MDPNTVLREIRERQANVKEIMPKLGSASGLESIRLRTQLGHHLRQIEDLFGNLDGWLTRGGFLPDDWKRAR